MWNSRESTLIKSLALIPGFYHRRFFLNKVKLQPSKMLNVASVW